MLTPLGVLGGLRGVMFFNIGGTGFNGQPLNSFDSGTAGVQPLLGYVPFQGQLVPVFGPPVQVSGLRLVDSFASYGLGLQTEILGFPIHFDWAWKTKFNQLYEDVIYFYPASQLDPSGFTTGSQFFRKVKFQFWIGYDF